MPPHRLSFGRYVCAHRHEGRQCAKQSRALPRSRRGGAGAPTTRVDAKLFSCVRYIGMIRWPAGRAPSRQTHHPSLGIRQAGAPRHRCGRLQSASRPRPETHRHMPPPPPADLISTPSCLSSWSHAVSYPHNREHKTKPRVRSISYVCVASCLRLFPCTPPPHHTRGVTFPPVDHRRDCFTSPTSEAQVPHSPC